MYRLTLLHPDTLQLFEYQGNPWTDTVPNLCETLSEILEGYQSPSTILRHLNIYNSYCLSNHDIAGNPLVAIIAHLPK